MNEHRKYVCYAVVFTPGSHTGCDITRKAVRAFIGHLTLRFKYLDNTSARSTGEYRWFGFIRPLEISALQLDKFHAWTTVLSR